MVWPCKVNDAYYATSTYYTHFRTYAVGCDALLGAATLGDIGLHFPDNDDRWKGVDSKLLLKEVMSMVRAKGYELGNADITIALQAPKLRPHIDTMRSKLAEVIGTDVDDISIKATTTERLGFVGRKEGCEVWATVIIHRIQP